MSRIVERDTSSLSNLRQSPGTRDAHIHLQAHHMSVTDAGLEGAPDDVTYYLQAYYPESEAFLMPLCRTSSSSIDADPNPLSTLLLDDISQRVASVIGTITKILVERTAFPAEADLLDWDAAIEAAPSRPSTTINASIEYVGRSKPIPVDASWE